MRPPEPSPTTDPYLGRLLIIRSLSALISINKPAIRFNTKELSQESFCLGFLTNSPPISKAFAWHYAIEI
jgi:hypothetical protein